MLRLKSAENGSPVHKARLVAKGHMQKAGVDYHETFNPVVRYDTIRTLIALAAEEGLQLKQFDIKSAVLNGKLREEVFMEQPLGFEDGTESLPGKE